MKLIVTVCSKSNTKKPLLSFETILDSQAGQKVAQWCEHLENDSRIIVVKKQERKS